MPIQINNQCAQKDYPINHNWFTKLANWLLEECQRADYNVSIVLTDDKEIRKLNAQYRQKDQPTNVLSFPFGNLPDPSFANLPLKELGEIVISLETAFREAIEYGQGFQHRITWLLTHGMLHLIGYDHERSQADEDKMFTREAEILQKLQIRRRNTMAQLAINVDHVATIRQARGIEEPDPVTAAAICELAGAVGIVVHLREDRRHIQDRDVHLLRETVKTKLNLEMGANKDIIKIALAVHPDLITLVPEKREELTTEGGLDVVSQKKKIAKTIEKFSKEAIPVSLFLDPDSQQLATAKEIGATFVELHTGRYCDALSEESREKEYKLIADAAEEAMTLGLRVCAGHGLNYQNTAAIAALPTIEELSIGHAIISRAVFSGLENAVKDMLNIVKEAGYFI